MTGAAVPEASAPLGQPGLRAHAADRIRAARPDLAERHDLASLAGLLAAQRSLAAENAEDAAGAASAVVVLHRFDLAQWVRDSCAFALGLGPGQAAAWRASFTRTVFLAGNPAHLRDRFAFAHLAPDGSAAWTAPGPAASTAALRRLLKLFDGRVALPPRADTLVEIPALDGAAVPVRRPRGHRGLYVATAQCTVAEALVHLNHVLAEAVLDGLIAPGDRLTLHQAPRLVGVSARLAGVRVVPEPQQPGRLRATAALTEEAIGG